MSSKITSIARSYRLAPKSDLVCQICERSEAEAIFNGDRHDLGLSWKMCIHCGHVFLTPRPGAGWFRTFYQDYYWQLYAGDDMQLERDVSFMRSGEILDAGASYMPAKVPQCLDVGCGMGGMLRAMQARFPKAKIMGVDPSADVAQLCRDEQGFAFEQTFGDCIPERVADSRYELITLIHVMEHLSDPLAMLRSIAPRLADDGILIVDVPDIGSDIWRGRTFFHIAHMSCFHRYSIEQVLRRAGLEPVVFKSGMAKSFWPWGIGAIARLSPSGPIGAESVKAMPVAERAELMMKIQSQLREPLSGRMRSAVSRVVKTALGHMPQGDKVVRLLKRRR